MEFLAGIIVYFLVGLIWGLITQHVSESKGYSTGFAWGFWLGFVGLIVVACKPTRSYNTSEYTPMYPNAVPASTTQWICACGAKNTSSYCPTCRRTREEAKAVKKISCPHCGAENNDTKQLCFACNQPLHASIDSQSATVPPIPPQTSVSSPSCPPSYDANFYTALEKLHSLFEQGILTEEEYQQKKAKILEKM